MSTKKQAIAALMSHAKGATLTDESSIMEYRVQLEAPEQHHWQGETHCIPVAVEAYEVDNKGAFWACVIEEINTLPQAVKCASEGCEGIRDFGECEYWD